MAKRHNQRNTGLNQAPPKKGPAGAVPPEINSYKIDIRPFNRTEQSVPKWRNALKAAESLIPRRRLLYDLYADVELDTHITGVWGKRLRPVTNANWQFVNKAGEPLDAVNQIVDSIGFESLLTEIMNSKTWGYSIMEPTFWKDHEGVWQMEANLIPRLNYRPETGIIAETPNSDTGINIRTDPYYFRTIMEVGDPKDLGLLLKVAPFQILKRGGVGDWATFVQVFGNPLVDATWDGFDETQRLELLNALKELGASGVIVRPAGTTVDMKDKSSNANGELQAKFMDFLNKEISKGLLGTTESTESSTSSGYAQASVHAEQDDETNESDLTFVRRVLNSRFTRILQAHGFDTQGGTFELKNDDEVLEKTTQIDYFLKAKEKGIPIDYDQFYEVSGMNKPKDFEEQNKPKPEEPEDEEEEQPEAKSAKKGKKQNLTASPLDKGVRGIEKAWKTLSSFFASAPTQKMVIGAGSQRSETCCETLIKLTSTEPNYSKLFSQVKEAEGKAEFYPELFNLNAELLTEGFSKGWATSLRGSDQSESGDRDRGNLTAIELTSLGITYNVDDPRAQTAFEMNLFRFSATKAAYQSKEVNDLFRRAKSFNEFQRLVKKLYGVSNRHHLETEYNTAYQTGQSVAQYYRILAQKNTFPYVEIRTIGDDKVRKSHQELNGRLIPIEHALILIFWTPFDWNCRCFMVPRLASEVSQAKVDQDVAFLEAFLRENPAWKRSQDNGFGKNPAVEQKVFEESQFYTSKPDQALQQLSQLNARQWNLLSMARMQALAKADFNPSEERAIIDELFAKHKVSELEMRLLDYAKRPLTFHKRVLYTKTAGTTRHQFLSELESILQNADEVWVNPSGQSFTYVKFYRNTTLKVKAKLNAIGDLEITDWNGAITEASRKGLVVKN